MEGLTLEPKWLQRSNPLQTKLHRISSNGQIRYQKKNWLKASAPEKLAESLRSRKTAMPLAGVNKRRDMVLLRVGLAYSVWIYPLCPTPATHPTRAPLNRTVDYLCHFSHALPKTLWLPTASNHNTCSTSKPTTTAYYLLLHHYYNLLTS